ncbi:MAG TPA: MFS transporter [Thermoanaerobaculia bacterium]|nr:MFS transporter [Thermoanaerobaculia bacterium]
MQPIRRYKWQVVAMLWCVVVLNYADRQALSGTLPLIRGELKLSMHEQGMLGAAFAWVYGLCSPFAGRLVDRMRRTTGVIAGLHVWSAICAATAFVPGFRSLVALRAAEGLGETAYFPASVSLISDYHEPATRSRALGLHQTGVYVGIVGGTTAAASIGIRFGWRAAFLTFGVLGIALAVVLRFVLRDREDVPPPARKAGGTPALHAILKPAPLCLLLAFICANAVASVLFVWLPTFVYDRFHQTLAIAGFSSTIFAQAGSFAGALAGGWLADAAITRARNGRIKVQAAGLWLGVPFVLVSGLSSSLAVTLVAFLGWGFAKGLYEANIFASMFDVTAPEIRGTVVGIMNMAGWLFGAGTAPILVGYVAERSSLGAAIASTAMIYVAGGVLLIAAARLTIECAPCDAPPPA